MNSLNNFYIRNKKLILTVLAVWIVIVALVAGVAWLRGSYKKAAEPIRRDPSYIPPIDQRKIDLIMSQPDYETRPVVITEKERQAISTQVDTNAKPVPNISEQEKERILRGY